MSTQLRRSTRKRVASARQASIQSKVRASSSLPQSPRSIPTPSRRNASSIGDSGVVQMPQIPVHLPNSDVATTGLTILSAATGSTMTHNDPGQSTSGNISTVAGNLPIGTNVVTTSNNTCIYDTCMPHYIQSVNSELAFNVPQNIQEKIKRSEYIDIALLLSNYPQQNAQKLVFKDGQITVQSSQNQKITTIEQWTTAFISFISIYCTAHPNKLQELLKYMSDIRLGALRSTNWKSYDEQFRLRKERDPTTSWSSIDVELWLLFISGNTNATSNPGIQNSYKRLKCYSFNYEGHCTKVPCQYRHACIYCNFGHSLLYCPKRQGQAGPLGSNRAQNPLRHFSNQSHMTNNVANNNIPPFSQHNYRSRAPGKAVGPRAYFNQLQ